MKSKLSFRTFLIYFLCIALPVVLLTTNYTLERLRQMRTDFLSAKSKAMDYIAQTTASQFDALETTANEIYRSSWYKKSISRSAIYQREFNLVRQLEISSDLMYKTTLLPFAEDILIIDAAKDSVICKYGWFADLKKYTGAYCELDCSSLQKNLHSIDLFAPIRSLSDCCWVLSYPDPNRASDCRIAVLIDSAKVQQYLNMLKYDSYTSIALRFQSEGSGENLRTLKRPALTLAFAYPSFDEMYRVENASRVALSVLLALAASAMLAVLFTHLFTRPLDKLLQTISHSSIKTQRDAIEGLTSHILEITEQNEALQRKMGSFANEMRREILLCMMTGIHVGEWKENYNVNRLFPWLTAGQPYFLVIAKQEKPISTTDAACLELEMPLDYHGYLFWEDNSDACHALHKRILEKAQPLACSAEYTGADALPTCYQETVEQLNTWKQPIPLSDLLPLLIHLQNGDQEKCRKVMDTFRERDEQVGAAYVLKLLRRWAEENGFPAQLCPALNGQEDWDAVELYIVAICDHSAVGPRRSGAALIASVNHFMNDYYCLPDLSLKYLAGQFDTSVGALSRLYKQETGQNFSVALLELRIARAKEILVHTNQNIASIALSCGYENYLSFKRAFSRSEGISPRDYREANAAFLTEEQK